MLSYHLTIVFVQVVLLVIAVRMMLLITWLSLIGD